jgi:hypothetical protein
MSIMIRNCFALLICFSFVISATYSTVKAQSAERNSPREKNKQTAAKVVASEKSAQSEERLAFAIQIVSSLADEARNYKDESLKVKVQARAADVLWNFNQERARAIFERARILENYKKINTKNKVQAYVKYMSDKIEATKKKRSSEI